LPKCPSTSPLFRSKENPEDKPAIPDYHFIDQLNRPVTPQTFKDKVYLTDFFFTSCPTICPIVTGQMLRIYEHFNNDNRVAFLSHSIDTRHDSVPRLKAYADKLHINDDKWRFVTGKKMIYFQYQKVT
jgi:protein SCO1/2